MKLAIALWYIGFQVDGLSTQDVLTLKQASPSPSPLTSPSPSPSPSS